MPRTAPGRLSTRQVAAIGAIAIEETEDIA
jgi:hypothetical protein